MEKNSIIWGVLLCVAVAIPVIYFNVKNKLKLKNTIDSFLDLGRQKGLAIAEHEVWRNHSIGIDTVQKVLLFQRKKDNDIEVKTVFLKEVLKCDLMTVYSELGTQKVIQRLELKLIFKAKDKPDVLLGVFDNQWGYQIGDEFQLSSKWKAKIDRLL